MAKKDFTTPLTMNGDYPNLDDRYTNNGDPYTSVSAAQTALASKLNAYYIGLTVLVADENDPDYPKAKEYWVQPKGTTPETYGLETKPGGTTDYEELDNQPRISDGQQGGVDVELKGTLEVSAETAQGTTASVDLDTQTAGKIKIKFSLPKGADGISPKVVIPVVQAQGEHTIQITDAEHDEEHPLTFTVKDGKDGKDAVSPFKGMLGTLAALNAAYPSPVAGEYAVVTVSGTDYVFRCGTDGVWPDSSTEVYDPSSDPAFGSGESLLQTRIVRDVDAGKAGVLNAETVQGMSARVAEAMKEGRDVEYAGVIGSLVLHDGCINRTYLQWRLAGGNYRYAIFPISGECIVTVTANTQKDAQLMPLSEYGGYVQNASVSVAGGQNTVFLVPAGTRASIIVPSGARYLYVMMRDDAGVSCAPLSVRITGENWIKKAEKAVSFGSLTGAGYFIEPPAYDGSNTNKWRGGSNYFGYKYTSTAKLYRGGLLRITANSSYDANVAIASEVPPSAAKDTVDWGSCYRATVVVTRGTTMYLPIPENVEYIQIWGGKSDTAAYTPASAAWIDCEAEASVDARFEELQEGIDATDEDITVDKVRFDAGNPIANTNGGHLANDETHGYYRHTATHDSSIYFKKLDVLGVDAGDLVEVTANADSPAYVLFIAKGGNGIAGSWTENSAVKLSDDGPHTIGAGTTERFVIPAGTTKIWVTCTTALGFDAKPDVFIIRRKLKRVVGIISYTMPERVVREKANLLTNMRWTPKVATIPYHGAGDYFYAVQEYKGLPYSSNLDHGKWLGTHVSLYTFLTAINNKYSLLYTESLKSSPRQKSAWGYDYNESGNGSSYYGTVCCALTGYVSSAFVVWNNPDFYDHPANFELIQTHTQDGHEFDLNKLKVGDILDNSGHSFVIFELKYNAKGLVVGYVAKEATYTTGSAIDGNVVKGAWTRPESNFPEDLSKFDHFRYKGMEFNTHINELDAGVYDNDGGILVEYNNDICTIAGDKCVFTNFAAQGYRNSNVIALNYNLNDDANFASTYDTIVVKNVTKNTTASYPTAAIDESGYDSSELGHALKLENVTSGKYEAWLTGDNGNVVSGKTSFIVVGADDFTAVKSAEGIRVTANNKSYKITYIAAYLPASGQESDYINVGDIKGNVSPLRIEHEWELENLSGSDRKAATNKNHSLLLAASKINGYTLENNYVLYVDIMTEFGIQRIKGIVPLNETE